MDLSEIHELIKRDEKFDTEFKCSVNSKETNCAFANLNGGN